MTDNKQKLYLKTYGCQMNFYDSEQIEALLLPQGFEMTETSENADLVILNTCHIREKAAEKVYSELGRIRKQKQARKAAGKRMLIAVAGCVAQAEGKEMLRRAPYVDMVVGPQSYQRLPQMVKNAKDAKPDARGVLALEFATDEKFDMLPEETGLKREEASAFLTIQEGCDKFCTFCVVPYTRGAEFSRSIGEITREAQRLLAAGVKEITLLGQNVNAYHGTGPDGEVQNLAGLVRHLAGLNGLERIRYTTSHPRDMDEEIVRAHAEVAELMPFIHLPVQSGSDRILKEMNRKHTVEGYLAQIEAFRAARPDIEFSSDFIVGFPGETDADFEETMALVRKVGYAQAYSFKYSPRPGTPAATREDSVPEAVKAERLAQLQTLLNQQQLDFNKKMLGTVQEVLFDRRGRHDGQIMGRTRYMQAVHLENAAEYRGQVMKVRITQAFANGLNAEMLAENEMQEMVGAGGKTRYTEDRAF